MGVIRMLALILFVLTALFACFWLYLRAGQRAALEAEWRRDQPPLPMDRYVQNGLEARAPTLRRTLALAVYVAPLTVLAGVIWWLDFA